MRQVRSNPAPLPVTLLALSVAVCVTTSATAAPLNASLARTNSGTTRSATIDQRDALEHLLAALTDAARKLGERLDHQALMDINGPLDQVINADFSAFVVCHQTHRPDPLRDALLSLPPPSLR